MPTALSLYLQVSSELFRALKHVLENVIWIQELSMIGIDILPIGMATSCCYAGAYCCCSLPQGDL